MYKAIISDFDGTIVDYDLVLNPLVANKVIEFQQKGFIFVIASGRGYFGNLADAVSKMMIKSPIIIRNGAEIIVPQDGRVIFGKYLKPDTVKSIVSFLIGEKLEFYVERGNYTYCVDAKPGKHAPNEQYLDIKSLDTTNVPKILVKLNNLVDATKYSEYFRSKYAGQVAVKMNPIKEDEYAVDINSQEVSKATAVDFLINYLNLDRTDIVAIGDNMNDLSLFERAGYKVAMGNGVEDLKRLADFVTDSVSNAGIIKVIDKIVNNKI